MSRERRRLAAAGLGQVAVAASSGWLLALFTAKPDLLDKINVVSLRRLRQCHVDLLMMGGLITAAGAACDPPPWAEAAVVVGGWTNPALSVPMAIDPKVTERPAFVAASVASFLVTSAGWAGVARAAWRQARA